MTPLLVKEQTEMTVEQKIRRELIENRSARDRFLLIQRGREQYVAYWEGRTWQLERFDRTQGLTQGLVVAGREEQSPPAASEAEATPTSGSTNGSIQPK